MEKKMVLSVSLPKDIGVCLKMNAAKNGVSHSSIIETLLREFLGKSLESSMK